MHSGRSHSGLLREASLKRAAPYACRLVIMAKVPVAGTVKTRLARQIGTVQATRFYRATARVVIARLIRQPFWTTYLSISPNSGVASKLLPAGTARLPQGGGDLGARMQRTMRSLPPGPVCIIGTDIPAIRPFDIRKAFQCLGRADVVFGPAEDGGFWLVGMRRRPHIIDPYRGVRWSRSDTRAAVEANLRDRSVAHTSRLSDVDNEQDFERCKATFGRLVRPI